MAAHRIRAPLPARLHAQPQPPSRPQGALRAGRLRPHRRQPHRGAAASTPSAPSWSRCATPTRPRWPPPSTRTGARGFASLDALLAGRDADCVVSPRPAACTRSRRSRCARAGRRRDDRKADGDRWEDGLAMVRACDEAGVRLFVVKQNRRNATLQLLKQAIDAGPLRPHLHGQRQRVLDAAAELLRQRAVARHLGVRRRRLHEPGEPLRRPARLARSARSTACMAYTGTLARNIEVEDTGVLRCKWRNGALGIDQRDDADLPEEPRRLDHHPRREGHGAHRRRGRQRDPALGVRRRRTPMDAAGRRRQLRRRPSVYGFGHPLYYDNVINTLRGEAAARDRRPRGPAARSRC